jgi:hypothetical protein
MKTVVYITGQINGNHKLANAISTYESKVEEGMFYSKVITFPTKKSARKALWNAFKEIRKEGYCSTLRYNRHGYLMYDSSIAKIQER